MSAFDYTPEQRAAIQSRKGSILVAAAAGSGKTRVLVERLMSYITDEGRDIDEFLVITYTKAAAAELRGRILDEISKRASEEPDNRHLLRQLTLIYRARINTIHSFCQGLIRENAHLTGISQDFRIVEEGESEIIMRDVLDEVLSDRYDEIEKRPAFRLLADTMAAGRDDSKLCDIVISTRRALLSHPYPEKWSEECIRHWETVGITDAGETLWGRYILKKAKKQVSYWKREMCSSLDIISGEEKMARAYTDSWSETISALKELETALGINWDEAVSKSRVPFPKLSPLRNYDDKDFAERVKDTRESCKKAMKKLGDMLDAKTSDLLEEMDELRPVIKELLSLVSDFGSAYAKEKSRRAILDFSDLEHLALDLLVDKETGGTTELAALVSERFTEIMVDEYQDVNSVQDMLFEAVSRGKKNILMVGDVKQSIYRFRLANPMIFLSKYKSFRDEKDALPQEAQKILLSKNFRSRAGVLSAINFIFKNIMSEDFGEMEYTEREALYPGAEYPENGEKCFELCIVDTQGDDEEEINKAEAEARFVAEKIKRLVESGMKVSDGEGSLRPVRYGDIMLLLRTLKDKAEIYASALQSLGVPVSLPKKEGFFTATEITTMISLLEIIDNPHQDIPLIAILRSPLYGFTPDELAEIRAADRECDFYDALKINAETNEKSLSFLDELTAFRKKAPEMSADRLLWRLYVDKNALSVFGAMYDGEIRRSNLLMLFEYAKDFESAGYAGLFGFVNYLRKLAQQGREPEMPAVSDNDAVTITSIHKSKGLESPVVVLADTAKLFNKEDMKKPLIIHPELGVGPWRTDLKRRIKYPTLARMAASSMLSDEMLAEEMRVLYVALTRAREKIIVTCSFKNVTGTLKGIGKNIKHPAEEQILCEYRSMAEWLLAAALTRPDVGILNERAEVHSNPALEDGGDWSAEIILASGTEKETETVLPTPDNEAPAPDEELIAEIASRMEYEYPYMAVAAMPSKLTATGIKGIFKSLGASEEAAELIVEGKEKPFARPAFVMEKSGLTPSERGIALHVVMQHIVFSECMDIDGANRELKRLTEKRLITQQQVQSVNTKNLVALFSSELGSRIMQADNVLREFKFSLLCDAGNYFAGGEGEQVLLQGVVDCCIEEDSELTIIDYKTDYVNFGEEKEHAERYSAQLKAYSEAMERITGKCVKQRILYFFSTATWIEV